jgi:hypothetical protein
MARALNDDERRLYRIFLPFQHSRHVALERNGTRLVHYTTAETALKILRRRSIWLRNAAYMDDVRELIHGYEMLVRVYRETAAGSKLRMVLQNLFPGLVAKIESSFNGWAPQFRGSTFISCFAEHDDDEDNFGRLSMWRAYGRSAGVALIVKNDIFLSPAQLKAYAVPAGYFREADVERYLSEIADNIAAEQDLLRGLNDEFVGGHIFNCLRLIMVSTKHVGFREEREWRVIYCPELELSPHIGTESHTLRGVEQTIHTIPLKNIPEIEFEAEIPALLDRVIIGPSPNPEATKGELVRALADAGVANPEQKVCISEIILRQ